MNIEVRLRKGKFGNVKAYGSIVIDEAFVVRGIRVLEDKNGRVFVGFPSRLRSDGNYEDIAFPTTKEAYSNITDSVLKKYEELVSENPETEPDFDGFDEE